jgi:cytochrome c553
MYPKKTARCLVLAATSALCGPLVAVAAEVDVAKGEQKSQVCIACHGEKGISQQDNYPHLHGQRQTYLLRQMRTFRDGGDRRDPIMTPMLENMTDQDLQNLAAYFSSFSTVLGTGAPTDQAVMPLMASPEITGPAGSAETASEGSPEKSAEVVTEPAPAAAPAQAATGPGDAASGQTKSAACAACHGADGRGTTPLFPNLNGQKPEYLAVQLKAFRDGKRSDPTMAPMAMALTDQDIADLAAFYGGLK